MDVEFQLMRNMTDQQRLLFQTEMGQRRKNPTVALLLTFFTGGIGGQMFYLNDPITGVLYLLFCWTFLPLLLSMVQLFTVTGETRTCNTQIAREVAANIKAMDASRLQSVYGW